MGDPVCRKGLQWAARPRAAAVPCQGVIRLMLMTKFQAITRAVPVIGALTLASCTFQAEEPNLPSERESGTPTQDKRVSVVKTPGGGIQPQAVVDAKGAPHLIYFKGEPGAGDLFYVRREAGKT